jgi:hypothetical protein
MSAASRALISCRTTYSVESRQTVAYEYRSAIVDHPTRAEEEQAARRE